MATRIPPAQFSELLIVVWESLKDTGWHWFAYHFDMGPRPFAMSILASCASINACAEGLGTDLLRELLKIGGQEKHEPHYEQLLQKLAEILVIERIVTDDWPLGTTFEHEPAAFSGGPRPELLITFGQDRLVIEVKTPSLFKHIRERAKNGTQLAYRSELLGTIIASGLQKDGLTKPRDNPIRDFLVDADRKFKGFRNGTTSSLLVIVWDDYIYEPISVLTNGRSGLLTANSFVRTATGEAQTYPNIDGIVAIRHMNYFLAGSREATLGDRATAMDFGDEKALPNVLFDVAGVENVPSHVVERLRAYPHDDAGLKLMAEYHPQDIVFWI